MLGRVRVPGADVFVLQGFELLLGAEFVGLCGEASVASLCMIIFGVAYHVCRETGRVLVL